MIIRKDYVARHGRRHIQARLQTEAETNVMAKLSLNVGFSLLKYILVFMKIPV